MNMKRLLTTAALMLSLTAPAFAGQIAAEADEEAARNHGYETAALEVVCPGMVVTNPKLRAQLDRKYRENPKWRQVFLEAYEQTADRPRDMVCLIATGDNKWLKQNAAERDQTEIRIKRDIEARKERLR